MAVPDDRIVIRGEFEDAITAPAEAAHEAIRDLEDADRDASEEQDKLGESADKNAESMKKQARETEGLTKRTKENTEATKKSKEALDAENKEHERGERVREKFRQSEERSRRTRKRTDRDTKISTKILRDFGLVANQSLMAVLGLGKGLAMIAGLGGVVNLLSLLGPLLRGVGAAGIAGLNGIGPLFGALAGLPSIIGGAVQGMAVMKLAMSGIGSALGAVLNPNAKPEEIAAAMSGLTKNAKSFVLAIRDVSTEWKRVRSTVQEQLFAGFDSEVKSLTKTYLPILNTMLTRTAYAMNILVKAASLWLRSSEGVSLISKFLQGNVIAIAMMAKIAGNLLRAFLRIAVIAQPMTTAMLISLDKWTQKFDDFTKNNAPALEKFFLRSHAAWQAWSAVVGDFIMGLYGLIKLSAPMTKALGSDLTTMAKEFRSWVESAEGAETITNFFVNSIPLWRAIVSLVGAFAKGLFMLGNDQSFLHFAEMVQNVILPALFNFIDNASEKFAPALETIFGALQKLSENGLLDASAAALQTFANIFAGFADWFASQSPETKKMIGELIIGFLLFGKFIAPLAGLLKGVFGVFKGAWPFLQKMFPFLEKLAPAFAKLAPNLLKLAGPVGIVIGIIITLIQFFVWLWQTNEDFRNKVMFVWGVIVDFFNNYILPTFQFVFGLIQDLWEQLINSISPEQWAVLMEILKWIGIIIGAVLLVAFGGLAITIGAVILVVGLLIAGLLWLGTKIVGLVQGVIYWIWQLVLWLVTNVPLAWGAIVDFFAMIGGKFVEIGGWIQDRWEEVVNFFTAFGDAFVGFWNSIPQVIQDAIAAAGKFLRPFLEGLGQAWALLQSIIFPDRQPQAPAIPNGLWHGGTALGETLVGELGMEIGVDRATGNLLALGLNGPEIINPSREVGVIPNSALHGGSTGDAPSWAVDAFRGQQEAGRGDLATMVAERPSEEHYHAHIGEVHVRSQEDIDMTMEKFKRMFREMERENRRRK